MFWLGVFCCGVQACDARVTCGAEKATQGARVRQHGRHYGVQRTERSGSCRCERLQSQGSTVACCGGTSCGAACMSSLGVDKTTGGGCRQWHAAWGGAAAERIANGTERSGGRCCEPWTAGAEQQQRLL
eukprot:6882089-Prymnesium_polylepis.1